MRVQRFFLLLTWRKCLNNIVDKVKHTHTHKRTTHMFRDKKSKDTGQNNRLPTRYVLSFSNDFQRKQESSQIIKQN